MTNHEMGGYLTHHGIDGQKWGVRNGPPYPLDYNDHSAEEKKKNSKGSISKYDSKQAQKDFEKMNKNRRGFADDRLAKTKTVKSIYKNNKDEIMSLRKDMIKARDNYAKVYEDVVKGRNGGKLPFYDAYEDAAATLTADMLAGKDLKSAREKFNAKCQEWANEAFGDLSSVPLRSLNGDSSARIDSFIADAIIKIDNNEAARDIILGRNREGYY